MLHAQALRRVPAEAEEHAGRGFEPARSVDDRVRQRPVGREQPHARSAADGAGRPRRRLREPGPPHHLSARNAGHQPVCDDGGARRRRGRSTSAIRQDGWRGWRWSKKTEDRIQNPGARSPEPGVSTDPDAPEPHRPSLARRELLHLDEPSHRRWRWQRSMASKAGVSVVPARFAWPVPG